MNKVYGSRTGITSGYPKAVCEREKERTGMQKTNIPVIRVTKAGKTYGTGELGFEALKDVTIEFGEGEFAAIAGKSGSGKSTLLHLIGGIDTPTKGSVIVAGNDLSHMNENRLAKFRRDNAGFVFQFFQLMPTLTVLENVVLPMDFSRRLTSSARRERAKELLDKVGMYSHADKFPAALSGGEQQRVAIARALANDPAILLADEPTGNLDSRTAEDVFLLLESLAAEGKSIVMVTHNEELAARASRRINIRDGQIVSDLRRA
jgi:putative ABC transport system ATP-binding protein